MSELFSKLGIEWQLLLAQVVNFAILAYILQRFVYKPLVKSLNERREAIAKNAEQGEEIALKLKEAEILKEELLAKARTESEKILKDATLFATKIKEEKLQETQNESALIIASAKKQIEQDRNNLRNELKKEIGTVVALAVEKVVGDVADTHAQKKLVDEAMSIIREKRVHI